MNNGKKPAIFILYKNSGFRIVQELSRPQRHLIHGSQIVLNYQKKYKNYREIAKCVVPGSPDWFISDVLICSSWRKNNKGGYFFVAFISKPYVHIFILQIEEGLDNKILSFWSYIGQINAHHERTTSIAFCESEEISLFTCGLDGLVRCWRYINQEWVLYSELNVHSIKSNNDPFTISSFYNSELNYCVCLIGTNRGLLIIWCLDLANGKSFYVQKKYENETALTSAWGKLKTSFSDAKCCVGYKKGIIGIYSCRTCDITSDSCIYQVRRLYAHERDVCHVVWNSFDVELNEFMTTGRDQMIKVWNCSSNDSVSVKVPGQVRITNDHAKRSNSKATNFGAPWISASFYSSEIGNRKILFCGLKGEMHWWNLIDVPSSVKVDTTGHSGVVFSMQHVVNSSGIFITVGQDRSIIVWKVVDECRLNLVLSLPTLSAGICSLVQSAHGSGPLVAGLSDGTILILRMKNCLEPSTGSEVIESAHVFSPRGQQSCSITALACHPVPQFDNIIVYGTEAGCVEIVDLMKLQKSHKSHSQPHIFGSTVYRVAWGPMLFPKSASTTRSVEMEKDITCDGDSNINVDNVSKHESLKNEGKFAFYVYSVCKGRIYVHMGNSRPPIDVSTKFYSPFESTEEWKSITRSDISFLMLTGSNQESSTDVICSHYSCLIAIGYRSGNVDVYVHSKATNDNSVALLCRIACHSKGINSLAWSPAHLWLAIGSNETFITITDIKCQLDKFVAHDQYDESTTPVQLSSSLTRLEGHFNRITCLDWSPHNPSLLLSSSFDGTANVWHIPSVFDSTASTISNFRAHRLRLFACLWSRHKPDLAFSGGELCHLFGWKPSEQLHKEPPHSRRYRPPVFKRIGESASAVPVVGENAADDVTDDCPKQSDDEAGCDSNVQRSLVNSNGYGNRKTLDHNTSEAIAQDSFKSSTVQVRNSKTSNERRKRPALFPNLLNASQQRQCAFDLTLTPPIQLNYFFTQILNTSQFVIHDSELYGLDREILLFLPETLHTRAFVFNYASMEAENHLQLYQTGSNKPSALAHLDAYFIILIWIGRMTNIASVMSAESYMPYWLLWGLQMAISNDPFFSSNVDNVKSGQIDLLGSKVKELRSIHQDALIASTLLVCGRRISEAVELLLSYNRVKEALLLCHLRLEPKDSWNYVERCAGRLNELSNEKSHYSILYHIGLKQWQLASNLITREADQLFVRFATTNREADQLGWHWINISVLVNTSQVEAFAHACLRLAVLCLQIGFRLYPTDPQFFTRWFDIFSQLPTQFNNYKDDVCGGLLFTLLMFDVGRLICSTLHSIDADKAIDSNCIQMVKLCDTTQCTSLLSGVCIADCIKLITRLASDRQPSSRWECCLTYFCIDFLFDYLLRCHGFSDDYGARDDGALQMHRANLEQSRQLCSSLKPIQMEAIIHHLSTLYDDGVLDRAVEGGD